MEADEARNEMQEAAKNILAKSIALSEAQSQFISEFQDKLDKLSMDEKREIIREDLHDLSSGHLDFILGYIKANNGSFL